MDNTQLFEGYSFEFVKISNHLIGVQGGEKTCAPAVTSRKRNWTNDSSSNFFPAGKVRPGVTPQRAKPTRRHTDHPGKASARNGNQ